MDRPLTVGISGASGLIYAVRTLKYLLEANLTVDVVASKASFMVWQAENGITMPLIPITKLSFGVTRQGFQKKAFCAATAGVMWERALPVVLTAQKECWSSPAV